MALAIKNVKVVFHEGFGSFIIRIRAWLHDPKNVNQNGHLVIMPMHGLHFVLKFQSYSFLQNQLQKPPHHLKNSPNKI